MSRNRAEGVPEIGSGLAAKKKKSPYQNKHSYVELGLLSAKQEQTKTRDDYEESKLEILSAVKELVPGPQALSHRHS